jgi:hypothetical protein
MSDPVTLDFSKAIPIGGAAANDAPADPQASTLQGAVAYGASVNPDEYAKLLKLQKQTGVPPAVSNGNQDQVRQAADVKSIDYQKFAAANPRTTAWASNPDNAAVSGVDELQRLAQIEAHSNAALTNPLQALIDERARVTSENAGRLAPGSEFRSAMANINTAFFDAISPLLNAGGAAIQGGAETAKALTDKVAYGPNFQLMQRLNDIWNSPRTFAVQGATEGVRDYLAAPILAAPQSKLAGGSDNPDFAWWKRPLVNTIEGVPGTLAAFALGGKSAGVGEVAAGAEGAGLEAKTIPSLLGTKAAQDTYADARAKGADQKTAIVASLQAAVSNYALMGAMPGGVPTSTFRGAVGQWAGRSAALGTGMAMADNSIAGNYDAKRGLFEGIPQSIATMSAFEGVGALSNMVDLAADSKLKARSPEKFQEAMQAIVGDQPNLRVSVQGFDDYFQSKGMDPVATAQSLGVKNLAEGKMASDVYEIPTADFLSKLDPEHQRALLPDIIDPVKGMSVRQYAQHTQELKDFETGGGFEKMQADTAAADAETAATPEYQQVKEQLRQRYTDAGETPEVAETLATKDANAYSNLARNAGMKPSELLNLYNPKVTMGEAPGVDQPRVDYAEALARYIDADPDGAIAEYSRLENTDGGRILSTDDARELSEHYREDRTRSVAVHEPASQFIKNLYAKKLSEPVDEGRDPLVLFTAGGTGAGKSSALTTPGGLTLQSRADIVYDANMNTVPSAEKKIQQALDSGRDVAIQYTYRDPVEALTGGALPRAMRMGRTVPLEAHLDTHVGSRKTIETLQTKYAEDPRVRFSFIDNSLGKGNARAAKSLDSLPQIEENGLREKLQNALDEEHSAGRISEAVRNGTAGTRRDVQVDSEHSNPTGTPGRETLQLEGSDAGSSRQPESQSVDGPLSPRNFPTVTTPDELKPYDVARVPVDQLHLDPSRFQYKMNVDAAGVTNLLKGRKWNEDLAGVISVWRDPADGKTYVVNGHHRFQLAKETGRPDVAVRMIAADTAAEARAKGAIQNIAEGRGTAMDAAKFFRDSGHTPADLDRLGVSMGEKTAADGLALAKLDPSLFDQVVNGKLAEGRAVAIGNATSDPADQEAILKLIDKTEAKGKHVTNETVNELARMVKGAGQHTETQDSLFGAVEETHSLVLEKAEVSSYIRKEISTEQRTFASVADESKAAKLATVKGQKINAARNSEIADKAAIAKELYDRLSVRSGTVDEILNRASRELADGGKPNEVKARAYADTRAALREALAGRDRLDGGVAGENEDRSAAGESADRATASELVEVYHQSKKRQPSSEDAGGMFPGMDPYVAERQQARANLERQAMEDRLRSPMGDISKAAGNWERNSPLGFGTGENPSLFGSSDNENPTLFQSAGDGTRGWFRVLPDGSYEIGKTKIGDLSTFVHEPAHAYLKILGDLAKREGASDTLKSDYQKVLEYLGAKDGEPLTREQHETWARANEQYLREGKAPSPGLKGTFQRFAIWLGSVYKKASDLGVELSDDIRGVFDRLYAAEDGVNKAEREAGQQMFTSPEEAGWTDEQFKKYAEQNNMTAEQAKSDILGRLNEAAVRARSETWRAEEQNVREAVTAEVDQKPEYSAIRSLRKGELDDGTELTLSRDDLVKQFGEERVQQLQKTHPGLYRNEGGEDPEIVAEVFGYHSAEEMMKAIEAAPRRSSAIETATRDYMTAKHGDIRYDGTLDDQARIALENDNRAEGLHAELTALKQKVAGMTGRQDAMRSIDVAPIASYREAARQMVEQKPVADLNPTRYLDASRKYSREAFDAVRTGDAQKAADAKHKELMNHFLFREATKAKEYIGKFEAYVKRVQKTAAQSKLGLAGSDYRDQFNKVLGRYGLGPQVVAGTRPLSEWAKAEYDQGKEPAIDPSILDESRTINYRSAPVSEVRMVHDALVNIRKLASLELGMEVNGKRIEFAAAVADMESQARQALPTKPVRVLKGNTTIGEKTSDYAQRGNALLMRTEFLMNRLDGGAKGPWHDYLWHLASDAQGNEYKLQEEVTKRIGDALDKMPKEQRLGMLTKVTVNGIPETVTRHDLVSMAMNMGNDGNFNRLQKTFISHGWDPNAIETVARTLTREEWQFVQDIWDSLKPLGQAQSDLERRLTGLPPLMVTPAPLHLDLADGSTMDLPGGYFPIVMDPRYSKRGTEQDAGTTAQNLMETGYGRAATSRGNMQARTGFGGPLQLDYEQVLTQHTAKVIKDITHREFMLAANKLLLDPQLRLTIRETLGDGYEEKMMPWLRTIINDRNGSTVQGLGDVSRIMRSLRTNIVKAALTFKVSTVLLQVTHASSMFNYTSPGSYAQAMVDFMAHPKDVSEEIRNLSPNEMSSRGENIDRDLRALIQTETGKRGVGHAIARAGMAPVQFMDHVMSFPLWLSVYRDGLQEGVNLPEKDAQYQAMQKADGAVRMGLGSNAPKDLPPIMRNNDFTKLITTLGGFHNLKWNQISGQTHELFNGQGSIASRAPKFTYGMLLAAIIPPILGQLVTGHGPKDGENPGLWAAKRALLFPFETIPGLGNIVEGFERKGETSFSPLQGMAERAAKAGAHAASDSDEKDWTAIEMDGLQSAMEAFGVVGTDQTFKTARYARQASKGNIESPNVWDAVAGSAHK